MKKRTRREVLASAAALGLMPAAGRAQADSIAQEPGERPEQDASVVVENPRMRVPLSFIIDDSTCLVNLNKFTSPQFGHVLPESHGDIPWRQWPDEIPDDFVRKFVDWCGERGVKGKYSIVPYPACVGRLDREIPGWGRKQLADSLRMHRERVTPGWDIHPEMVTHSWVINTKTGHPYAAWDRDHMENWGWSVGRSADSLAEYMAYALQILRNVEMPCEGLTTPGGFGNRARSALAKATLAACREVYGTEIPHYFRYLFSEGTESVAPRVEYAAGLDTDDPRCVVSVVGCTGDWTGGWNCSSRGYVDRFMTADLAAGRLVDVIERGEPACWVCHWTGIYWNGEEYGFRVFQEAVRRVHAKYDAVAWMKLSEISRYWAAKELTGIQRDGAQVRWRAPFACPAYTLRVKDVRALPVRVGRRAMREVGLALSLEPGTFWRYGADVVVCWDLEKGQGQMVFG